jgi:hypothetical protein
MRSADKTVYHSTFNISCKIPRLAMADLIAIFRALSSISLPFVSSIQAV